MMKLGWDLDKLLEFSYHQTVQTSFHCESDTQSTHTGHSGRGRGDGLWVGRRSGAGRIDSDDSGLKKSSKMMRNEKGTQKRKEKERESKEKNNT